MAGTLSANFSAAFTTTAGVALSLNSGTSTSFTIAGSTGISLVQAIGTSAEALTVTDVGTLGWIAVRNTDSTNYVELALDSTLSATNTFAKLLAGEWTIIKANPSATYYARANTASCNVQTLVIPA